MAPRPPRGRFARRRRGGTNRALRAGVFCLPHELCDGRRPLIPTPGRCGARASGSQARLPGGAGAPPGTTRGPCQELADDRKVYSKRFSVASTLVRTGKRGTYGESAARRSNKRRDGAPKGAARPHKGCEPNGFALFGAPFPSSFAMGRSAKPGRVPASRGRTHAPVGWGNGIAVAHVQR